MIVPINYNQLHGNLVGFNSSIFWVKVKMRLPCLAIPQSLLKAWGKNLTIHFVLSPQYRAKLEALTKLIERHQLRPVIDSVLSWDQVVLAHQRLEQGGTRGKIVLNFTEN